MVPLPKEQVNQTCQTLLAFLSDDSVSVPAPMIEGIVSGKSLLRGILSGQLAICQVGAPVQPGQDDGDEGDGEKE